MTFPGFKERPKSLYQASPIGLPFIATLVDFSVSQQMKGLYSVPLNLRVPAFAIVMDSGMVRLILPTPVAEWKSGPLKLCYTDIRILELFRNSVPVSAEELFAAWLGGVKVVFDTHAFEKGHSQFGCGWLTQKYMPRLGPQQFFAAYQTSMNSEDYLFNWSQTWRSDQLGNLNVTERTDSVFAPTELTLLAERIKGVDQNILYMISHHEL